MKNIFKSFRIPHFFKTKKFLLLLSLFVLFFLFTPVSLYQLTRKAEDFINERAEQGVQKFEQQTRLKIKWEKLRFSLLTMTVYLEDVSVAHLKSPNSKKSRDFQFLGGLQKVRQISARPSLYSLLFEERIILSHLRIKGGDIELNASPLSFKDSHSAQKGFPVRKIFIEETDIHLKHKEYSFIFSQMKSTVFQRHGGGIVFDLFVREFYLDEGSDIFQRPLGNIKKNKDEVFQLALRGLAQNNRLSFKSVELRNQIFQSSVTVLNMDFKSRKLKEIQIRSQGVLPWDFIQKGIDILGWDFPFIKGGRLSYGLEAQYKKNSGWKGGFSIEGKEAVFKLSPLQSFVLKGRLLKDSVVVDKGFLNTKDQGSFVVERGEWFFRNNPSSFRFSLNTKRLSSVFFQSLMGRDDFFLRGDFTGTINCFDSKPDLKLKCTASGQSENIDISDFDQNDILSFYGVRFDSDFEWREGILKFKVSQLEESPFQFGFQGELSLPENQMEADFSLFGNMSRDLKFHAHFPIEGVVSFSGGNLKIEGKKLQIKGFLNSSLLKLDSYGLKNVSTSYEFKDNKLKFFNFKGRPGKTGYSADCEIDFEQKKVVLNSDFSFLDIEDVTTAVREQIPLPFPLRGTGTASLSFVFPWENPDQKKLSFKGSLFNILVDKDFFQQADWDFHLEDKKGLVRSLHFKKGQGFIRGSGFFDENFILDMDLKGDGLSLEGWSFVNEILPFNQSGDVQLDVKLRGPVNDPSLQGSLFISRMFFDSDPVKNSELRFNLNKKILSLSGHIMDEIYIRNFTYPFSSESGISVEGSIEKFDFIKGILSKNRMDQTSDYSSQVTGSFSLSQNKKSGGEWKGFLKVTEFSISKFNQWIKSDREFSVFFNNDVWSVTDGRFSLDRNKVFIVKESDEGKLLLSGELSLSLFSVFFPFVKRLEGNVRGQFLVDNNLKQFYPDGVLHVENMALSFDLLPEFRDLSGRMDFSKNHISISRLNGSVGEGSLEGGGKIFYDFLSEPNVDLNLKFSDVRFNIPKDFNTRGSGEIKIQGEKPPYSISGDYLIESGDILKDFSEANQKVPYSLIFLDKQTKKEPSVFTLRLKIRTETAVFISNSLIESAVEGQAEIYGPLNSLRMDGEMALSEKAEEKSIFFRGHEFKINSGSILFKDSEPQNPYLDIQASTLFKKNIVDPLENNQEVEKNYTIFLSVKGPVESLEFSFESSPTLNEREIVSLLTLGVEFRHFDTYIGQNITDYSYKILGSLLLEKPLNREIKKALGLDFRLTPYINDLNKPVTKITLSRSWFEKWKTSFSRTIEDETQSDVRLKYDLNERVSLTSFWENVGNSDIEEQKEDFLGLDLEFNFDF